MNKNFQLNLSPKIQWIAWNFLKMFTEESLKTFKMLCPCMKYELSRKKKKKITQSHWKVKSRCPEKKCSICAEWKAKPVTFTFKMWYNRLVKLQYSVLAKLKQTLIFEIFSQNLLNDLRKKSKLTCIQCIWNVVRKFRLNSALGDVVLSARCPASNWWKYAIFVWWEYSEMTWCSTHQYARNKRVEKNKKQERDS